MDSTTKASQQLSRLFEVIEKRKADEAEARRREDEKLRRMGRKAWWREQ